MVLAHGNALSNCLPCACEACAQLRAHKAGSPATMGDQQQEHRSHEKDLVGLPISRKSARDMTRVGPHQHLTCCAWALSGSATSDVALTRSATGFDVLSSRRTCNGRSPPQPCARHLRGTGVQPCCATCVAVHP